MNPLSRWLAKRDRVSKRRAQRLERQGRIPVPADADDPTAADGREGTWGLIRECVTCNARLSINEIYHTTNNQCPHCGNYGNFLTPYTKRSHFYPTKRQKRLDQLEAEERTR